ncbi:hypothetical protein D3C77_580890 [compost metagenome]
MPHAARVTLALQERLVHHLQIDDTPSDHADQQREQGQDDTKPPGIQRAVEFHGATSCTSAAAGMCIFNCSVASASIRL